MSELNTHFAGPFEYDINISVVAQNALNVITLIYGSLIHLNLLATLTFYYYYFFKLCYVNIG